MNSSEKIESISIAPNIAMIDALKLMDQIDRKLLVVMEEGKFIGLLSIGDIQRAIIKNFDLSTPIKSILRKNIKVATENDDIEQIKKMMLQYRIECLPILTGDKLNDVIFWEDLFSEKHHAKENEISIPLVIMAGGQGSRLKPFSNIIPKPLFPIGEKTILERIIENFNQYNVSEIYLSVNYKSEMIKQYVKENINMPVSISYIQEPTPLGTAGSLSLLKGKINTNFFVSNCDIIIDQDYSEIYEYHVQNNNDITLVAVLKSYTIPYGTIESGDNGMLLSIKEKPDFTHKINSGMYILKPEVLSQIPENKFYNITDLISKVIQHKGKVGVFPISEKSWTDIGEWNEYKKTLKNIDW